MLKASFIQSWYCEGFTEAQWKQEFNAMRALGLDTLILADLFEYRTKPEPGWTFYYKPEQMPGEEQGTVQLIPGLLEKVLGQAKKYGMRIFLGTGSFCDWWRYKGNTKEIVRFYRQAAQLTADIYRQYGATYRDVIAGWYFVPEIANLPSLGPGRHVIAAITILIESLERISPGLPLMLSPYYNCYFGTGLRRFQAKWTHFLKQVPFRTQDILAPQDAVGAGWTPLQKFDNVMEMYRQAIAHSGKTLRFWINCENFTQPHNGFPFSPPKTKNKQFIPADIGRFAKQLQKASDYTDTVITFSYGHYYSPLAVSPEYHKALLNYITNHQLPKQRLVVLPAQCSIDENRATFRFYSQTLQDKPVLLDVYKNGKFQKQYSPQLKPGDTFQQEFQTEYRLGDRYWFEAQDAYGNTLCTEIFKL